MHSEGNFYTAVVEYTHGEGRWAALPHAGHAGKKHYALINFFHLETLKSKWHENYTAWRAGPQGSAPPPVESRCKYSPRGAARVRQAIVASESLHRRAAARQMNPRPCLAQGTAAKAPRGAKHRKGR